MTGAKGAQGHMKPQAAWAELGASRWVLAQHLPAPSLPLAAKAAWGKLRVWCEHIPWAPQSLVQPLVGASAAVQTTTPVALLRPPVHVVADSANPCRPSTSLPRPPPWRTTRCMARTLPSCRVMRC